METNAVRLASLLNRYLIQTRPPKSIVIPQASQVVKVQEITVLGRLLKNQVINWDLRAMKRRIMSGKRDGSYALREDGSLEFCIGVKPLQPHIVCRFQREVATTGAALQSVDRPQDLGQRLFAVLL